MQIESGPSSTKNQSIIIPDLEEFEFKAIGEGLGFHQKEEKPRWSKPATTLSASARLNTQASKNQLNTTPSNRISKDQLGFLYNLEAKDSSNIKLNLQEHKAKIIKLKLAGLPERFTAQLIDTVIITLSVSLVIFSMLTIAGVPFREALKLLSSIDIAPVVAILWTFAYISYFTILETKQTPGKSIMRIAVVDMNGSRLSLSKSLERTVFRSLSWLALGFPLLMNFHGRLSGSKVIKQ